MQKLKITQSQVDDILAYMIEELMKKDYTESYIGFAIARVIRILDCFYEQSH